MRSTLARPAATGGRCSDLGRTDVSTPLQRPFADGPIRSACHNALALASQVRRCDRLVGSGRFGLRPEQLATSGVRRPGADLLRRSARWRRPQQHRPAPHRQRCVRQPAGAAGHLTPGDRTGRRAPRRRPAVDGGSGRCRRGRGAARLARDADHRHGRIAGASRRVRQRGGGRLRSRCPGTWSRRRRTGGRRAGPGGDGHPGPDR